MAYTYEYPRPSVTVDAVVLNLKKEGLSLLMIQRGSDPFKDHWALPGGFLDIDESPEEAVKRELEEETGLKVQEFIQIEAFADPERDPRGRVISITFLTVLKENDFDVKAASDAKDVKWFKMEGLPAELAFDHDKIVKTSLLHLKKELKLKSLEKDYQILDLKESEVQKLQTLL